MSCHVGCGCWDTNQDPLQAQQVPFITESHLQPQNWFLKTCSLFSKPVSEETVVDILKTCLPSTPGGDSIRRSGWGQRQSVFLGLRLAPLVQLSTTFPPVCLLPVIIPCTFPRSVDVCMVKAACAGTSFAFLQGHPGWGLTQTDVCTK